MNLTSWWRADARQWRTIAVLASLAACVAVASTYRVFSNMFDEPAHIATGMELLSYGTYTYEPQHPPLGRIASAVGPWFAGARATGQPLMFNEGRTILGFGEHYERMLALARLGQLPFLIIVLATTWYWARWLADARTAAIAVLFVATNSNVLAHAGVAGTDIAPAAMMPAALLAWTRLLEAPDYRRALVTGLAVALSLLAKFSAMAHLGFAAVAIALVLWRQRGARGAVQRRVHLAPYVGAAALVGFVVVWGVYQFTVGRVGSLTLPAPALWRGLQAFFSHATGGHNAFLLGEVRSTGWWYFDLVALAVKTPLPLLLLGLGGLAFVVARRREPLALAAVFGVLSVLIVNSITRVENGIRMSLPLYVPLAVLAAVAFWTILDRVIQASYRRALAAALLVWMLAEPVRIHPDHIAYFNQVAGPHPEEILVDSNLDWGQDLYRLRDVMSQLPIDSLRIHYFGSASIRAVGVPRTRRLQEHERARGWVGASETFYAGVWADTSLSWLRTHQPVARVGRSIRLYRID